MELPLLSSVIIKSTSEVHCEWVSSVTDGVFNGFLSLLSSVIIKSTSEVHCE